MNNILSFLKQLVESIAKSFAATTTKPVKKVIQPTSHRVSGVKDIEMIKEAEGLRLRAYLPTPNDVWTIGYGHTKTAVPGMNITRTGAEELLRHDLAWVENAIEQYVKVTLNQTQYDALASFIYNVGATAFRKSTMLKLLNTGDYKGAADQFPRWNKQKGKVLNGLTKRRQKERALFLK